MGCPKLTYHDNLPTLKVAYSSILAVEKPIPRIFYFNRKEDAGIYLYGFGGHEKDDEVSGNSNHLAFGDYGYNPRLGRRFNIDPMVHEFPHMSPYAAFHDNPIYFADPTGLSPDGPGDREINKGINSGDKFKGHKSLAGKKGTTSNGNVVFADVSKGARLGPFANASRIATANGLTTDQLYALNPGLKENKNNIGQGQLIYVSVPNAAIMNNETSKDGKSLANKSSSNWLRSVFDYMILGKGNSLPYQTSGHTSDEPTNDGAEPESELNYGNMPIVYGTEKEHYSDGMHYNALPFGDTFEIAIPTKQERRKINGDSSRFVRWDYTKEGQKKDYVDVDAKTVPLNH